MRAIRQSGELEGLASTSAFETKVLKTKEERKLLQALAKCKTQLAEALSQTPGAEMPQDDPQALSQYIAENLAKNGAMQAELGATYKRYAELRSKLALANMRLVAHVAKRFRDRGVSYSDLLQEGFCGLLEAIDRFDLVHGTKLATYATWWIRQAMQRAVAATAYPVRLSPRHLRQLARNQEDAENNYYNPAGNELGAELEVDLEPTPPKRGGGRSRAKAKEEGHGEEESMSSEVIQRIHAATRPTISLDASMDADTSFNLLQTMSDPEGDRTNEVDMDEAVDKLMEALRPRERQVLELRFGLGGSAKHSLSQVGKVLEVSKERVRQIQDRALEKLRNSAIEHNLADAMLPG